MHQFGVFGARVENDPLGAQGKHVFVPLRLILWPNVQGNGINIGQDRSVGVDIPIGHCAFFDAHQLNRMPILASMLAARYAYRLGLGVAPNTKVFFGSVLEMTMFAMQFRCLCAIVLFQRNLNFYF